MEATPAHHVDLRERETRDRLVEAAVEVFSERGYEGTRVADIARRAGYTTGALYTHFESRADLLAEAIAAENGRRLGHLTDALVLPAGVTRSADEIAATLMAVLSTDVGGSDQLLLDGLAASPRDPRVRERLATALRELGDRLEERMAARPALEDSTVHTEPGALAYLGLLALLGAASLRAVGLGDLRPDGLEPLVAEVLVGFGVDPDGGSRAASVSP